LTLLRAEWEGRRLDSDPLLFPHRYRSAEDRELVAFIASSLAFGRVASIQSSLERVLSALGPSPAGFLDAWHGEAIPGLARFKHRWVTREDLRRFLNAVRRARNEHGSLRNLFAAGDHGEPDYVPALDRFYGQLTYLTGNDTFELPHGLRFLLPQPGEGSACKRAHLFLRWMVRDRDVDLGLWSGHHFRADRLLLPMDTHVHRISRYLGITRRATADLIASREATQWLRRIDTDDPVSFDWALSRLGILAECSREITRSHCERCAVRPVCRETLVPYEPSEERSSEPSSAAAS